jgi:hypothetical protein
VRGRRHGRALRSRVATPWGSLAGIAPDEKPIIVGRTLASALVLLHRGRLAVACAIAAAATLATFSAVRWARAGHVASRRLVAAAAVFAALALVLFIASRGHAYDGAHPLPVLDAVSLIPGKTVATTPQVERCGDPLEVAPIIDVGEHVTLRGEIVDPAAIEATLRAIARNTASEMPNVRLRVVLVAAATTPTTRLLPLFAAVRAAGYSDVDAVVIVPHVTDTRTLGPLERPSICARKLSLARLDLAHAPPTWAALALQPAQ